MDSTPQAPPSATEYLRLVGIAALIGIPAALAAALFLGLIHGLEDWLWHDLPASLGYAAPPWFFVLGLPVLGRCSSSSRARSCPVTAATARSRG